MAKKNENDVDCLRDVLPHVMEDLKRRSPTLTEDMKELADTMTDHIMDAAMEDVKDLPV